MPIRLVMPTDRVAIEALFRTAERRHHREALSEHKALRIGSSEVIDVVATDDGTVVGYGQAAWHGGRGQPHWAVEVVAVVDDDGETWSALATRLLAVVPSAKIGYLWVTSEDDLLHAFAMGYVSDRSLYEMRRALPMGDRAAIGVPADIELRPFRRGRDEQSWLDTHNVSFEGHPEVGGMTHDELDKRMAQPWFDPGGLLLAWRGGRMLGSCWTKLHAAAVGEIYLIGIHPDARGMGLGVALVIAGLSDLATRQGARQAKLYVDGGNRAAFALYETLGFESRSAIHRLVKGVDTPPG